MVRHTAGKKSQGFIAGMLAHQTNNPIGTIAFDYVNGPAKS